MPRFPAGGVPSNTTRPEIVAPLPVTMRRPLTSPSIVIGTTQIPVFEFQVQVPRALLEEARHVVEQAKEAGPAAALEAERATEEGS